MITLTLDDLKQMTGAALLAKLAQQPERQDDLQIAGTTWRVYSSTHRGKQNGTWVHLWRQVDTVHGPPRTHHVRGKIDQRIAVYSTVE